MQKGEYKNDDVEQMDFEEAKRTRKEPRENYISSSEAEADEAKKQNRKAKRQEATKTVPITRVVMPQSQKERQPRRFGLLRHQSN